jgi:hypothetical protein
MVEEVVVAELYAMKHELKLYDIEDHVRLVYK